MKAWLRVPMAAMCVLVSACGDEGSSVGSTTVVTPTPSPTSSPTPTPAPSPTPTPTPTPSPAPSYTTYDALTGDQTFASACSGLQFYVPPSTIPSSGFGQGYKIAFTASTQTYSLNDGAYTFGPADADPNPPTSGKSYVKARANGSGSDRFRIFGSSMLYNRPVQLQTVNSSGISVSYFCVIGVPTRVTDVPSITTASFGPILIGGSLYDTNGGISTSYSLQPTTVTFNVDLSALTVVATMHLLGQSPAGAQVDFGTYAGTGTIDPNTGSISGTWTSNGRDVFGQFGGTFFGPQGKEVAIAYNISSRMTGQSQFTTNSAGYFYGSR